MTRVVAVGMIVGWLFLPCVAAAQTRGAKPQKFGNWTFDPNSGAKGAKGQAIWAYGATESQMLAFFCGGPANQSFHVMFVWGRFFTTAGDIEVKYNFSNAPSNKYAGPWVVAPNHKAAAISGGRVGEFVGMSLTNEGVTMQVADTDGEPVTAKFDLHGFRQAYSLLPECGNGRVGS